MKSHAHQSLPRKRIKKLAAQFSDDEIRASLHEDDENRAFIYQYREGYEVIGYWNAYNGPMIMLDDDSVRAYAQLEYLRRNGHPTFKSDDEVSTYATAKGWPRKARSELGKAR
jgi:Xaa-Pro aminopeptidase